MKNLNRNTVKSLTRNALFLSMMLHIFLLITLFYFSVSDQPVFFIQDKIDASIETLPKQTPSKKPINPPIRRQIETKLPRTALSPLAKVESITPEMSSQSRFTQKTPIETVHPRLTHTNTTPEAKANVSTALNLLREVENGISKTEALAPTVDNTLGSKRSGSHSIQRSPNRTTLGMAGTTLGVDENPTDIGNLHRKKPQLTNNSFQNILKTLANDIINTSNGGPIDVVFVIDASGSMGDNIKAVVKHLTEMIDVYEASNIDYALGLTEFHAPNKNVINITQLTKNFSEYKKKIQAIVANRDENAIDAITKTVRNIRFRATSKKHLILVTDEPLTSIEGRTVRNAIGLCLEYGVYVNVLGLLDKEHQLLADQTGGEWHPIPEKRHPQTIGQQINTARYNNDKARWLANAKWSDAQLMGKAILQFTRNSPVDIILFIDGSKSMEDKLRSFKSELDIWIRDWDNALIDYQIGVVRYRKSASVNMVNVFQPPQTPEEIHKILELPGQDDEDLLHALTEGMKQIKLRRKANTHFIIVTDEPLSDNTSSTSINAVIQFLQSKFVVVNVLGTADYFQERITAKTNGLWLPIPGGYRSNKEHR